METTVERTPPRPIGYWVKHLHDLLERQFEGVLAELGEGLGRRHWQVLHILAGAPRRREELRAALAPFWDATGEGVPTLDGVVDGPGGLAARGWAYRADGSGTLALTPEGEAAHAYAARRVERHRAALSAGLTSEQYAETVRVLSVMAANAEAAEGEGAGQVS